MSNDMESMRTFADQLWKYMVPKLDSKFASNVSYFRAQVVSNPGNNKLEVQRPMENGTLTLPCIRAMSNAQPGQQVVALVMGSMSNAIVVGDGNLNVPGGGGDVGIANFQAQPDGSLVITLINGNTLTATPHDPTKQDVLTFDDVPTQGSNNPVKSGGVYTALDNKVDKVAGKGLSTNDFTNALKDKLDGIEAGAEVNQNAFSNIVVGSVTVSADSKQDTLTLNAGGLVNITGDATNGSVTISVDPNHTHITTQVLDLVNADSYGPSWMVSFDADVAEVPLKNCIVNIEPVQAGSGTPSPTNVRAISGWTGANVTRAGKNLLEITATSTTINGVTITISDTGVITCNGTATSRVVLNISRLFSDFLVPGVQYHVTDTARTSNVSKAFVQIQTSAGGGVANINYDYSFVYGTAMAGYHIVVRIEPGVTVSNQVLAPMIYAASAADYVFEPFKGEFFDISFPTKAGTVYGGTLDVLKGTLTVDRASVTITGGLRYYQEHTNHYRFNFSALDGKAEPNSTSKLLSDTGVPFSAQEFSSASVGVYIGSGAGRGALYLNKSLVSPNNESANAWVANHPVQIVYPLETPITYQLSPQIISTLLGSNSIWADCGTISVDYGAFLSALDKAIEEHSGDDIRHITEAERTAWDGKQNALTFDDVPTAGSSNPVKSGGIKMALDGKADSNHTHGASDITSGILPAARGGTGNGNGYIQIGQESGTTLGLYATAEGLNVTASGTECHAEGAWTVASGSCSHAEGLESESSGNNSHAEGYKTVASGSFSHAEGNYTTASNSSCHSEGEGTLASGDCSHAEGAYTIAAGWTQHVFGRYNVSDITNVEIVGWGTSSTRKNIRTLGRTGNEWIAGTLTQASDARLKDVQGEIPDLSKVRAVRFRWKNGDDKEHLGYLAQDVEEIAPYLVDVDSNGYKSLDYIALLTAKVEMLEQEIEKLKQ